MPPDIIVTGERVPRTLRDTPASVAVATERMIDEQAAPDRVEQVLEMIPNVQLSLDAGRFTLFAYGRNLLDDFHLTYLFNEFLGTAGDPRELGVGVEARF